MKCQLTKCTRSISSSIDDSGYQDQFQVNNLNVSLCFKQHITMSQKYPIKSPTLDRNEQKEERLSCFQVQWRTNIHGARSTIKGGGDGGGRAGGTVGEEEDANWTGGAAYYTFPFESSANTEPRPALEPPLAPSLHPYLSFPPLPSATPLAEASTFDGRTDARTHARTHK